MAAADGSSSLVNAPVAVVAPAGGTWDSTHFSKRPPGSIHTRLGSALTWAADAVTAETFRARALAEPGYEGGGDEHDLVADVSWWVVAEAPAGVADAVAELVPEWLDRKWPFESVRYPFGEVA